MDADQERSVAIQQLKTLGLSTYAARTFVGLVSLDSGTAQEVSDVVDVPRTRVYDAVEELQDRGLVDIQQSNPKRFRVSSVETASRHFEQRYRQRVNVLKEVLNALETRTHTAEQRGVWTVTGRDTVTERATEFIRTADEEVVYMTTEDLLDEVVTESMWAASERGVRIRLAEMSPSATRRLEEIVPKAETFESLWDWSDTPAGRLLMVDGRKTLVSVLVSDPDDAPVEPSNETAIWGTGQTNNLVVVLKTMFTWQLDRESE